MTRFLRGVPAKEITKLYDESAGDDADAPPPPPPPPEQSPAPSPRPAAAAVEGTSLVGRWSALGAMGSSNGATPRRRAPEPAAADARSRSADLPRAFYLLDGAKTSLRSRSDFSVGDALEAAALALNIAPAMTRYLAFHAATAEGVVDASPLPTAPPLARTWRARFPNAAACARQGKAPGRLVLLVRLWTDELRRCVMSAAADDGGITRLAYVQARACVMMDLWPCPLEDAALVAAVQLSGLMLSRRPDAAPAAAGGGGTDARYEQAAEARASAAPPLSLARDGTAGAPPLDVGESPRPRLTPSVSLVRSKLASLLPERVLKSRESGEWELDVLVELGFRLNDPHASAASDYLAIVETWDSFGTVAFSGYVLSPKLGDAAPGGKKRGPRDKCVVCVGRDGVRVLSTDRLRTLGVLAARRIARWVPRPCTDGDGDDGKGASELVFEWAPPSEGDDAARVRCVFRLQGRDAARDCCALLDDYGTLDAVPKSNSEPGDPDQTSELSSSATSKSIRLIFGRIDRSRRVLEARQKSTAFN